MWMEPLVPASALSEMDPRRLGVRVVAGDGLMVAMLEVHISPRGRVATCDELTILDDEGAPRQKIRALVLLAREAFRHAQELGQRWIYCEVPDRMADFVTRITGLTPAHAGRAGWGIVRGDLTEYRSRVLERTDADGNV